MHHFVETSPTKDAYWRSIVLFGRNSASYKFAIAATLDQSKPYGVSWSGRKRSKFENHRSKKRVVYETPREEWTALPVDLTGSGLDRATVDRAREAIKDNKPPSKVGDRFWELSGVLKCAECGRKVTAYRRAKQNGHNHYYRCRPSSTVTPCANRKSHPAETVEEKVANALRTMVDDRELLTDKIRESFDARRRELSRIVSDTAPLIERLADLDRRKEGYWDLAADGDMPRDRMRQKVEEIDTEQEALRTALDDARHRDERLEDLALQEKRLLTRINELSTDPSFLGTLVIGKFDSFMIRNPGLPGERRNLYLELGLRVEIDRDGRITIDGTLVPPPTNDETTKRVADRNDVRTLSPPERTSKRSSWRGW